VTRPTDQGDAEDESRNRGFEKMDFRSNRERKPEDPVSERDARRREARRAVEEIQEERLRRHLDMVDW